MGGGGGKDMRSPSAHVLTRVDVDSALSHLVFGSTHTYTRPRTHNTHKHKEVLDTLIDISVSTVFTSIHRIIQYGKPMMM